MKYLHIHQICVNRFDAGGMPSLQCAVIFLVVVE
ncbi:MAG: hypothetical protein IPL01_16025 [Acidobacteria bacterium]|nr:hypothetical protein [Acidobacteriota bacterium]